ncbi:MAG TPA: sialate O-acetylesterase [Longimicrobium sp.]|nr:sialate O-acetylesterase [Longimicrobium sp.]
MMRGAALALLLAAATTMPIHAQDTAGVRLARIFGDGMVVQRGAPVAVWGWAPPGSAVRVTLAGHAAAATADAEGRWSARLPALRAGGPHELTVAQGERRIVLHDVLVGDVWVASGQSNMEWPLAEVRDGEREIAAANDPRIRHFTVPHSWAERPADDLSGGSWEAASPETAGRFSAVAYFFARELRREVGVPIGIVHTSWGGSNIETWMSRRAQGITDSAWTARMAAERARDESLRRALAAKIGGLPTVDSGMVDGRAAWADPALDDSGWAMLNVPGLWEEQGYDGLDGVAWYRTAFTLTEDEARRGVTISLGMIDDNDAAWVNGVEIGRTTGYSRRRTYEVPASALRAGRNLLAVRVEDGAGGGGIYGAPETVFLESGGARRAFEGPWSFRVGRVTFGDDGQRINKIPTILYNRMIHPLLPLPIRGVIWYQGESNANNDAQAAAYREQFAGLITSWRSEWTGTPGGFPFLWAQLPNFGAPDAAPPATAGWAILRESQAAALTLPATGQAVIIEAGEAGDLHPRDKLTVGRRMARAALAQVYGKRVEWRGPTYRRHSVDGNRVTIDFDHAPGGLVMRGDEIGGFAIAGADCRWVWAKARVEGSRVVVWSDEVPNPVAVRYAWSNSPTGLVLYNRDGLPAAPFRTDDW